MSFFGLLLLIVSALFARAQEHAPPSGGNHSEAGVMVECTEMIAAETELKEVVCGNETFALLSENKDVPGSAKFFLDLTVSLVCVCFAGLMSGLTIGLMALDEMTLRIATQSTDPEDAVKGKRARRVLPLLNKKHWLLCTLLIANAAAMEALPIFLDQMVEGYIAVIISVTAVLIFGEIVPQAIFLKYALPIGAVLAPFIWVLVILLSPIGFPLSKLIDWILGESHGTMYHRNELKELIRVHAGDEIGGAHGGGGDAKSRVNSMRREIERLQKLSGLTQQYTTETHDDKHDDDDNGGGGNGGGNGGSDKKSKKSKKKKDEKHETALTVQEARIIRSVLDMNTKHAREIMTPMDKLEALPSDVKLDAATLTALNRKGKQYFAVRDRRRRDGIRGVLLATSLIGVGPSDNAAAVDDLLLPLTVMYDDTPLYNALLDLHRGNLGRMALICDHDDQVLGILTLDDIVAEMLKDDSAPAATAAANGDKADAGADVPIPLRPKGRAGGSAATSADGFRNNARKRDGPLDLGAIPLLPNRADDRDD